MIRFLEEKDICPDCGRPMDECDCNDLKLMEFDNYEDEDYYYDNVTFRIVIPNISDLDVEEIIESVRSQVDEQYEVLDYTFKVVEARYTYVIVSMKVQIQEESDTEFIDDILNFASDDENSWDIRDIEHSTNLNEGNDILDTAEKAATELMKDTPSKQAQAVADPDITSESPNITEISFDSDGEPDYDNEEDLEVINDLDNEQDEEEDQINENKDRSLVAKALVNALDDEDIDRAIGSLLSIDKNLYRKAMAMIQSKKYSRSYIAKYISDILVQNEVTNPGAIANIPGKHIKPHGHKCGCKKCKDSEEELECNLSEEFEVVHEELPENGDSTAVEINTQLSTFYDQLNDMGRFFTGSENGQVVQAIKDLQTMLKDLKV